MARRKKTNRKARRTSTARRGVVPPALAAYWARVRGGSSRRTSTRTSTNGAPAMARRKTRRASSRCFSAAPRSRRSRRSRSSGGGASLTSGKSLAMLGIGTVAGVLASNQLAPRIANALRVQALQGEAGQAALKAAIAIGGGLAVAKYGNKQIGAGIIAGGVAEPVVGMIRSRIARQAAANQQRGMAGLGYVDANGAVMADQYAYAS